MADLGRTAMNPMTGQVGVPAQAPVRLSLAETALDPLRRAYVAHQKARQIVKNNLIPVNIRQYVNHLLGDVSPITESQFTSQDLEIIRRAIEKMGGGASGSIGYGDYAGGRSSFGDPSEGLLDMLYKSYTDPAYRMETTLGMASYRRLPDGSYVVEDKYNFNAPSRQLVTKALREKGVASLLANAFKRNGMAGVLNLLGNVYGHTEDEPGAPVSIRLPGATSARQP